MRFLAEKLDKNREGPNLANSLLIPPTQHDIQSYNDPQMSLDYHLFDILFTHWEMMKRMSSNLMCLMAVDHEVFG
jgi:hypothetical protein